MSVRAGVVVTGTEVLTGRVTDRNGPWLTERLRDLGVDAAFVAVVGDRPSDVAEALRFFAGAGMDLVMTSGGLGPTADDLTAQVVADFHGRPMALDEELEARIDAIVRPLLARWPDVGEEALAAATRKQAHVPSGAFVLEPVGTAPGLVVPPADGAPGPVVVVLPGPPRELQGMWPQVLDAPLFQAVVGDADALEERELRMFGIPESEIAETLRLSEQRDASGFAKLEITTCLRRGEVEVVTRFAPADAAAYAVFDEVVRERHSDTLFSDDGTSIDEQVAGLLLERGFTIATAESCTGGLLGGRLTERAGSSAYVAGGLIVYSNEAKTALAGVDAGLIASVGAVSREVAAALAQGARDRLDADVGVGITGVAGPGGGTEEKPVGLVWFGLAVRGAETVTRSVQMPGSRSEVRDRSTTVALHMVRRALMGLSGPGQGPQ